jgi:hypothetical protein
LQQHQFAWLGLAAQNAAADSLLVLHQQWGDQDNYEVVRKVGRGKYSEVFEVRACHPSSCYLQQQCAQQHQFLQEAALHALAFFVWNV